MLFVWFHFKTKKTHVQHKNINKSVFTNSNTRCKKKRTKWDFCIHVLRMLLKGPRNRKVVFVLGLNSYLLWIFSIITYNLDARECTRIGKQITVFITACHDIDLVTTGCVEVAWSFWFPFICQNTCALWQWPFCLWNGGEYMYHRIIKISLLEKKGITVDVFGVSLGDIPVI